MKNKPSDSGNGRSIKDAIMDSDDLKPVKVNIPEWNNVVVFVRPMTGWERDAWEMSIRGEGNDTNIRAKTAIRTVCDADGNLIFSPDDAEWLGKKSSAGLERIFTVASKLNLLSAADVEELKKKFADPWESFVMQLALALSRTRQELLDSIGSRELTRWMVYSQFIEPLPSPWLQTGQICSTMASLWAKGNHPPQKFMPLVRRQLSDHEKLRAWIATTGIKVVDATGRNNG